MAYAYLTAWALVRWMPEVAARALFAGLAKALLRQRGRGVQRLESNLARVCGPDADPADVARLTRAGMRSYLRYWLEVFRLPRWSPARVVSRVRTHDEHLLRESVAAGRGVVVVLPHSGNWDHAGAWVVLTGVPFTTVAERLKPAALYDRFVAYRERLGMEVLPLTDGGQDVYRTLAERLRAGRMVCLLGDRDIRASGVNVPFFGGTARMPAGPAALALDTGAALVPATLWYDTDGTHVRFHPVVAVPEDGTRRDRLATMTRTVAAVFEQGIAAHPEDWHMLQRVWVDDPPAATTTVPSSAGA